jgi:hypothetical protein
MRHDVNVENGEYQNDVKLIFSCTRHELHMGDGGAASLILSPGTTWRQVVSYTLQPLYPQVKRQDIH